MLPPKDGAVTRCVLCCSSSTHSVTSSSERAITIDLLNRFTKNLTMTQLQADLFKVAQVETWLMSFQTKQWRHLLDVSIICMERILGQSLDKVLILSFYILMK